MPKVEIEQASNDGDNGFRKLEHDQYAAGLDYSQHLLQSTLSLLDIPQTKSDGDETKGLLRERKALGIGLDNHNRVTGPQFGQKPNEHRVTEVRSGGPDVQTSMDIESQVTCSCANIKTPVVG